MDAREQLQRIIDEQQGRLAAGIPPGREAALLALVRTIDALPLDREVSGEPDGVAGCRAPGLGVPTALQLALEHGGSDADGGDHGAWAGQFLDACRNLEAARLILRFAESGEMRLAARGAVGFDAWRSGRAIPTLWQERADIAWWARHLARATQPDQGGREIVARMAYQLPYPADAELAGVAVSVYRSALAALIDLESETGEPGPRAERGVIRDVARMSGADERMVGRALASLTLDPVNCGWHAALPGGPQAPLVRVGPDRLVISRRGLLSEPLFFLARELRGSDGQQWHNAAHLREVAFRQDLSALFDGSRFVTSSAPILLRWPDRRNRTDIDAAVFDRKSGTLGLFELKSQDAYARSADELERQLDNLHRAGRQMAAILDWINRNGADEVLNRMDSGKARRLRVQRVLPFVLGRYLAGAGDRRGRRQVAWGSWGQVLRLRDGASEANPLLSLHTRLIKDDRAGMVDAPAAATSEIRLGETRVVVHTGGAAAQAR